MKTIGQLKLSRRKFLGVIGKGAAVLGMPSFLGVKIAQSAQTSPNRRFTIREDRFGGMVPELSPCAEPSPQLSAVLMGLNANQLVFRSRF
jgi:hypothetical protein